MRPVMSTNINVTLNFCQEHGSVIVITSQDQVRVKKTISLHRIAIYSDRNNKIRTSQQKMYGPSLHRIQLPLRLERHEAGMSANLNQEHSSAIDGDRRC